ncbi:MAG: hypothetical protein JWQ32_3263 [Marmoricola sp.]|nr:hypothetical protein [Marmoricola sp.]
MINQQLRSIGRRCQWTSDPEILVGTDGSAAAAAAIEYALRLAELQEAQVPIVHVVASHRQIPPRLGDEVMNAGRLLGRSIHHGPVMRRSGLAQVLMNISECAVELGPEPRAPVALLQPGLGGCTSARDVSLLNHG